jgi:hypothetical protein
VRDNQGPDVYCASGSRLPPRKKLATLLLATRPMWRDQPYMYPVKRSSTPSWQRRSSGAD